MENCIIQETTFTISLTHSHIHTQTTMTHIQFYMHVCDFYISNSDIITQSPPLTQTHTHACT